MKNKTSLIVLILIIIILLAGGAYFMMKKTPSKISETKMTQTSPTAMKTKGTMTAGTLKSLLTLGKSVKCSFSNKTESNSSEGTVYVSGGKMRADFSSTSGKTTTNGHVIADSQFSYFWMDQSKQGFKFPITNKETSTGTTQQSFDMNQSVNYSCGDWNADSSVFSLPIGVTFSSFNVPVVPTGMTGNSGGTGTTGQSSQCAACNSLPAGTAQDACKTQLHCQ